MRRLSEIAAEIRQLWPKPYFGAVPYLNAMSELGAMSDRYLAESADTIVLYFLSNAQTWHGADARRIKKELNYMMLKSCRS